MTQIIDRPRDNRPPDPAVSLPSTPQPATPHATTSHPTTPLLPGPGWRTGLLWLATFVGFPFGGLVTIAIGPVDDPFTALVGGAGTGAVIGLAQWLVLRRVGVGIGWIPATAAGLAVGLTIGSGLVGYSTGPSDLLVQGAVSGASVGLVQSLVLARRTGRRHAVVWALASSALWPVGWLVTWAFGTRVDEQFAVFGATGAFAYTVLAGLLMAVLVRAGRPWTGDLSRGPGRGLVALAVATTAVTTLVVGGLLADLTTIDETRGGYEAPFEGWTGTPIDWEAQAVNDDGFVKTGYVLTIRLDCTTGINTGEVLGIDLPYERALSERALAVHAPREACTAAGFEPGF